MIAAGRMVEYDELVLRAAAQSLVMAMAGHGNEAAVWAALIHGGLTRAQFTNDPDMRLSQLSRIAGALGYDIDIRARDRKTGDLVTPSGTRTTPPP
jgi:hypothetical protein